MRLKSKVALITGASVGIGQHTALLFAREGARLVINSQSSRGEAVAEQITNAGGQAIFVRRRTVCEFLSSACRGAYRERRCPEGSLRGKR